MRNIEQQLSNPVVGLHFYGLILLSVQVGQALGSLTTSVPRVIAMDNPAKARRLPFTP
jgi:hypothetical protein